MNRRELKNRKDRPLRAVALEYDQEQDNAPLVTASGAGDAAKRILEIAREHGIPIEQDPGLLEVLSLLEVGEEIPIEIYKAVAEILAFIHHLDQSTPRNGVGPT